MRCDWLAVILCGGGSCWGRSPSKAKAIKAALETYRRDWGKMFVLKKGADVIINVVDVAPHRDVHWDHTGLWAGDERLKRPIEKVHRSLA